MKQKKKQLHVPVDLIKKLEEKAKETGENWQIVSRRVLFEYTKGAK